LNNAYFGRRIYTLKTLWMDVKNIFDHIDTLLSRVIGKPSPRSSLWSELGVLLSMVDAPGQATLTKRQSGARQSQSWLNFKHNSRKGE